MMTNRKGSGWTWLLLIMNNNFKNYLETWKH